ncbi:coiled-coil domain-containing protein 174-like isoform X2 [Halichondria panicea]|uniref:coiled-coil domain-containing protein 174-like isoform X2 n=1 Tax=Halichondria panicea TaxID=6063 RepID=UPI00312B478F
MHMEGSNKDKKIIQVSTSALIGLKAALYSKQQAAKRDKTNSAPRNDSHTRKVSDKTASLWKRSNKVKGHKSSKKQAIEEVQKELSQQEEKELERSRQALEAKAVIYEKLSKGQGLEEVEGQEGEESRYMVDFTRKVYDRVRDKRAETAIDPSQVLTSGTSPPNERSQNSPVGNSPSQQDVEEWVEYEDEFGRTRRCLKSELPEKTGNERSPTPQLLSDDMRRERERVQWERETEQDEPLGPIHYQSVQEGEIRNHGVGYYQFSGQEEQRKKQMEMLDKLRDETETERDKKQRLHEKRRALLEARLNKVKEKRNQRRREQGLADIEFEIEGSKDSKEGSKESEEVSSYDIKALLDAELEKSKVNSHLEQAQIEEEERAKHVRPWDKGKVVDMVRKRKQELEAERLTEFAPPPSYNEPIKKPKTEDTPRTNVNSDSIPSAVIPPPAMPSCHGNTLPPHSFLPPPPWFVNPPPNFIPPPPPPFLWQHLYVPPPPMHYPPGPPPGPPPSVSTHATDQ